MFSNTTNYLLGISHYLKSNGQSDTDYTNFKIREALRGAKILCQSGRGCAKAIFPRDLMKIFACLNMVCLDDLVVWSAITLAYRAVLKISNVCGKSHALMVKDLNLFEDRIIVKIDIF